MKLGLEPLSCVGLLEAFNEFPVLAATYTEEDKKEMHSVVQQITTYFEMGCATMRVLDPDIAKLAFVNRALQLSLSEEQYEGISFYQELPDGAEIFMWGRVPDLSKEQKGDKPTCPAEEIN